MSGSAPSSSRLITLNEELEMLLATLPKLTNKEHKQWCEMVKIMLKVAVPPDTILNTVGAKDQEKEQRRVNKGRGSHLISLVNIDEDNGEIWEEEAKIMVAEMLRGKPSNCIVFQQVVQRAFKEGHFKLADRGIAEMVVDTDPFPKLDIHIVSYEHPTAKRKMKQVEGISNGPIYPITGPKLVDMRQAKRRNEEALKFEKLRQQIHREAEVENGMKTLQIIIDNEERGPSRSHFEHYAINHIDETRQKDLIPTNMKMTNFTEGATLALGVLVAEITVRPKIMYFAVFIVDAKLAFSVLLGRD
ncbi:hypothetical protein JHK85_004616 [Glycine max]|nr:hypothetical protein JHK85_004616 [Glycine max]